MQKFQQHVNPTVTPQSQPIPGTTQVENAAGGFAWATDDWNRFQRFLILGTDGGSYYAGEAEMTRESSEAVSRCIAADPARAIELIATVSEAGRAPKNDPALFALALAASSDVPATRVLALAALPRVARIGTHLFHFAQYVTAFRRWGRGLRHAVAQWYLTKEPSALALQLLKYPSRDGWAHRDLLRLSHARPQTAIQSALLARAVGKTSTQDVFGTDADALLWWDMAKSLTAETKPADAARLIADYKLPREVVPTELLNSPEVWEALLQNMPMTALIRNLATLTRVGLLGPMGDHTAAVIAQLTDAERIRKARVHPIQLLAALKTYESGRGVRGQNTWAPTPQVVDALDAAFYLAFDSVAPTGLRYLLALDVSGSMSSGVVAGVPGLTPRVASSAMAMVTARTEQKYQVMAFSTNFVPLTITPRQRLDDICKLTERMPFSGTDCALPMLYAEQAKLPVDVFVVYTDSETWAGGIHPVQALRKYRQAMGIPAKLVVVGMVANNFTIADPQDRGMLDVVGFDTAVPEILALFAKGEI